MLERTTLFTKAFTKTFAFSSAILLSACSGLSPNIPSSINQSTKKPNIALSYGDPVNSLANHSKSKVKSTKLKLMKDGLGQLSNTTLSTAIAQAIIENHNIKEQQSILEQAVQQQIIVEADQGFNLSLASANSIRDNNGNSSTTKNFDLALQGSFTPDIWGALSAQTKAAHLQVAQTKANLGRAKQQLIADITNAWYQLIYNQKLYALVLAQQNNTQAQLAAIESSYNHGLSQSLDVYLARGNLDNARSNTTARQQALSAASRNLELLFAAYPTGKLIIDGDLALLNDNFSLGVPADLLQNRADLNSRWLAILAQDATVASRYAAQFPQFNLTGNLSLTSANLADLFKQNLAWTLLANINQTLFDNGKKKALYKQAQAKLIEREQQYLQALQNAFSEVENLLDDQRSLDQQWQLNKRVLENAVLSYEQVNIQYQNGIANYQQVLNIQQQLFTKQKLQLDFNIQLISNRINLLLALGTKE
ncbi:MAG: multidrug efflux system outer membrane protein [Oceanospirillaceae bacterium]|jgi:multidrug efflux system outer membrane protein